MATTMTPAPRRHASFADAEAQSGFLLAGLVWCAGCERQLEPLALGGGARSYDCGGGCRMRRLDAWVLERRVIAAAEAALSARIERLSATTRRSVIADAFDRIVVGGSAAELWFRPALAAPSLAHRFGER